MLQTAAAPSAEEDAVLVPGTQSTNIVAPVAKPRKSRAKPLHRAEEDLSSEAMPDVAQRLTGEATEPAPTGASQMAGYHRFTRRQAAAAQLPRGEHWKRRLHLATW
jgi:hypothetical protein